MRPTKVRVTLTDGMGRRYVHEASVNSADCTPSIAARDLIADMVLRDGDTLSIDFLYEPEEEPVAA